MRKIVLIIVLLLCCCLIGCDIWKHGQFAARPDETVYQSAESAELSDDPGINQDGLSELLQVIRQDEIYGFMLLQHNQVLVEYYKEGYDKDVKFEIYSCTKSIMSILIGIALDQGLLQSTDQYIAEFFPEINNGNNDRRKQQIRLQHLLSQTSGLAWSDEHTTKELLQSENWVHFVLDRPMVCQPGETFNYNSGGSHLLSAVLQQATGQDSLAFARTNLFEPLGIADIQWRRDPQGIYGGGFGLSMNIQDMAKIGLLYLNEGQWQGRTIVSKDWVQRSLSPQLGNNYGYQWWVRPASANAKYKIYFASGLGGQYIIIVPEIKVVAVFTGWIPEDGTRPLRYFEKYILNTVK